MGFYTAIWKNIIERGVDLVWQTIPGKLHHLGVFTDLDGAFPLPHYMWICPSIFGGVSSISLSVLLPFKCDTLLTNIIHFSFSIDSLVYICYSSKQDSRSE